jgi:hypothetical protein
LCVILCVVQMSDIVGFDIKPQDDTSLLQMVEYGLTKHLEKYVSERLSTTQFIDN